MPFYQVPQNTSLCCLVSLGGGPGSWVATTEQQSHRAQCCIFAPLLCMCDPGQGRATDGTFLSSNVKFIKSTIY